VPAELVTDLDCARMHVTLERLFALLRRGGQPEDVSLTAASALRNLQLNGPRRIGDLAGDEGVSQPAATQLVSRLEKEGLVERATDPADGRVVLVRITDAGAGLLQRRRQIRAERLAEVVHTLSEEDAKLIAAALPALERLGEAGTT
jgi:DNA-binding MarR family transcriptional regulator